MTYSRSVLIVCDQPLLRYGMRALLEQLDSVGEVVEAGSEHEALRRCRERAPDLVITDLTLPGGGNGLRVCRFVKERRGDVPAIVVSSDTSPGAIAAALNAGVDSFLHKSASCQQMLEVLDATSAGKRAWVLGETAPPADFRQAPATGLTQREEEILALLLKRRSNEEIADQLCLAQQTVKNYVSRVLQKLGFASRRELLKSVDVWPAVVPHSRARSNYIPVTRASSAVS